MEPIGVGDYVECIGHSDRAVIPTRREGREVVRGGLYVVRDILPGRYADGATEDGLRFVGIRGYGKNGREGGWPVSQFRKIYRPKASLLKSLLQPTNLEEKA